MRKIIFGVTLLSGVAVAKALTIKTFAVGTALVVFGTLALPGLVVGDAQWQRMTDAGTCNSENNIYTIGPMFGDKQPGKIKFVIPCNEWFELNR